MNKNLFIILLTVAIASSFMAGYRYKSTTKLVTNATALVYPTKGNTATGSVTFKQLPDGLHITAHISGLTPGEHGFHVHEFGNCACDDAVCAGGHYNPTNKKHGGPDATERHVGDFGNLVADQTGRAIYDQVNHDATLNGPHSIIGRAVIIHADPDDLTSQPTGNSGVRVGCGVIGIAQAKV